MLAGTGAMLPLASHRASSATSRAAGVPLAVALTFDVHDLTEEAILEEIPAGSARAELAAMTEERADVRFHLRPLNVAAATLCCALLIAVVTVATCHCRVHETYKRCLAVPCGRDGEDAMQAALTSKSTRGQPLLDSLREPSFPGSPSPRSSPTSKTAPLLDASDIYYALDFSDSQSSPLIQ